MRSGRPRSGLTKRQTRKTLESFNWTLGLRSVFDALCGATAWVFTSFALSLGVSSKAMGVIGAVVSGAALAQIAALFVSNKIRDKKGLMVTLAIVEPLALILAVVALPYAPEAARVPLLSLAAFCAASSLHLSKPVTDDWVAQSVPAALRPRFIGWRARLLACVAIFCTPGIGYAIDLIGSKNTTGLGYLLLLGAAFGLLAALPLRHASMPERSAKSEVAVTDLLQVMRDKPFRYFIVGIIGPLLPFFFILPYYSVYQLEVVGIDAKHLAWITMVYLILKIMLLKLAENLLPRLGPRKMLIASIPMYVAFFFFMGMAHHVDADASREFNLAMPYWKGVWPIAAAWWFASLGDALWNVAQGTLLYGIVPEGKNRPAFFAAFNLMTFMAYSVVPFLSYFLLGLMGDMTLTFLGIKFGQFQLFFLICSGMLALTSLTLLRMPNSREEVFGHRPPEIPGNEPPAMSKAA